MKSETLTTLSDEISSDDGVEADVRRVELEMQRIRNQTNLPPLKGGHIQYQLASTPTGMTN